MTDPVQPTSGTPMRRWPWFVLLAVLTGSIAGIAVLGLVWASGVDVSPQLLPRERSATLRVFDNKGVLLRERLGRPDGRNYWFPLEEISPDVIVATVASEDRRFWQHDGVDGFAILRAAGQNLTHSRIVSGASTLTMQLARVLDTSPQRSWNTKARQVLLAKKLELLLDKRTLLEQYLNRVSYGNGAIGIEAAARRYFDKPAAQLSLGEAATLAGLPRSPSGYNPFKDDGKRLLQRKRFVLWQMRRQGHISAEDYRIALAEKRHFRNVERVVVAPHFVGEVIRQLGRAQEIVEVHSTIDHRLQKRIELAISRTLTRLEKKRVTNAAAIVVDNETSAVLAYVGSADFNDADHSGQVDGCAALRQPGSTLKPFTYALALESGYTPATLIPDLSSSFSTPEGTYHPQNYSRRFHGPVRLRSALANSYNVPAIRTAQFVGVNNLLGLLHRFGFSSLDLTAQHYGLGLTLGNGEVSLQELVAAYAALARGGIYKPLRLIDAVRTVDGKRSTRKREPTTRVLSPRSARLITHMLSDARARVPAFGRNSVLSVGFEAAAKTGTSKDFRDNWTIGYTPHYTVGVWVGNFDGSSMHNTSGISGAAPLWAEILTEVVGARRDLFPAIAGTKGGLRSARICRLSGALATPQCPHTQKEIFFAENAALKECEFHQRIAIDQRNGLQASRECAAQYRQMVDGVVYPAEYQAWATENGRPQLPLQFSPLCPPKAQPMAGATQNPEVRSPQDGAEYYIDPDLPRSYQSIDLRAVVPNRPSKLRWLIDGKLFATRDSPYVARWPLRPGRHRIVAESTDGTRSEAVHIRVR